MAYTVDHIDKHLGQAVAKRSRPAVVSQSWFSQFVKRLVAAHHERQDERILAQLSDHQLRDIGFDPRDRPAPSTSVDDHLARRWV